MNRWDAIGILLLAAGGAVLFVAPAATAVERTGPRPEIEAATARLASAAAARADGRHDRFDALVGSLAAGVGGELQESLRAPVERIVDARAEERRRRGGAAAHEVERAIIAAARELGRAESVPDSAALGVGLRAARWAAVAMMVSAALSWMAAARMRRAPRVSSRPRPVERVAEAERTPDGLGPYGRVLEIVAVSE